MGNTAQQTADKPKGKDIGTQGQTIQQADIPVAGENETLPAAANGGGGDVADPGTTTDSFGDFAGQGLEGLGKDDLAIPFLMILQSGSPQCKRSEGEYIDGAVEGMLFNTVTKEIIDPIKEEVLVIPCYYDRQFVEWRLRESGGGFVAQHDVAKGIELQAKAMRDDKNRDVLPNGHQLNDTRIFSVIVQRADGSTSPALITCTSTQIKKAKQWLMQQNLLKLRAPNGQMYTPPMFASKWKVTTVPESNEKGSWMGWAFEHGGYLKGIKDPLFVEAQTFHKAMKEGAVKVDLSKSGGDAEPGTNGNGNGGKGSGGPDDEDDIPF